MSLVVMLMANITSLILWVYMPQGIDLATMIMLIIHYGIYVPHHLHRAKTILLIKEETIMFKKKFWYLTISSFQIILMVINNMFQDVSWVNAHLLIIIVIIWYSNFKFIHIQTKLLSLLSILLHILISKWKLNVHRLIMKKGTEEENIFTAIYSISLLNHKLAK